MTGDAVLADPARLAAAEAALERVEQGMVLGLGSGRAVWALIDLAARRWGPRHGARAAAASAATGARAAAGGFELLELDGTFVLDLVVDGADEVDAGLGLIKGAGAALLHEKLLVSAAGRFLVVAEAAKLVDELGRRPVPVEVVPFAWRDTRRRLLEVVATAQLRLDAAGAPLRTEEGNLLLDCGLRPGDRAAVAEALKATVGVVEHGLFLGMADEALLGRPDGQVNVLRR